MPRLVAFYQHLIKRGNFFLFLVQAKHIQVLEYIMRITCKISMLSLLLKHVQVLKGKQNQLIQIKKALADKMQGLATQPAP